MITRIKTHAAQLVVLALTVCTFGACSQYAPPESKEVGSVELALRSTSDDRSYELRNTSFEVVGPTTHTLSTGTSPQEDTLVAELSVGDYTVELLDGWQLFEVGESDVQLDALLLSDNPAPFTIESGQTTSVRFRFQIDGEEVDLGGELQLGFGVETTMARSVIFSELMTNPGELSDSEGEWIELRNVGTEPVNLEGCMVERDTSQFTVAGELILPPGELLTLANSDNPGFVPSYVYSGLTLPNSAVFVLNLVCGGVLLDSVTVDPSAWPGAAGVSASLSSNAQTPTANDDASAWCNAVAAYNADLGTPGSLNPSCH